MSGSVDRPLMGMLSQAPVDLASMADAVDLDYLRFIIHRIQDSVVPFSQTIALRTAQSLGPRRTWIAFEIVKRIRDSFLYLGWQAKEFPFGSRLQLHRVLYLRRPL